MPSGASTVSARSWKRWWARASRKPRRSAIIGGGGSISGRSSAFSRSRSAGSSGAASSPSARCIRGSISAIASRAASVGTSM